MSSRTLQAPRRPWWPAPEYAAGAIVRRSRQACWHLLSDVTYWPIWAPTVSRVDALDGPELRLGARFRIEQPGLRTLEWTVAAIEPGRWFTWRAKAPGVRMVAGHSLSAQHGTTLLTLGFTLRGALAPLVAWRRGRTVRDALDTEAHAFRLHAEATA
jgi:hypothetical protein